MIEAAVALVAGALIGFWIGRRRVARPGDPPAVDREIVGGIGHGLSNTAAALAGNAARLRDDAGGPEALDGIDLASEQVGDAAWLLEALASGEASRPREIDLSALTRRITAIVDRAFPASFRVRLGTVPPGVVAAVDPDRLLHVVVLLTARLHSPAGSADTVTVSLTPDAGVVLRYRRGQAESPEVTGTLSTLIDELPGRLSTRSEESEMVLVLHLEARAPRNADLPRAVDPEGAGQLVLVADDDRQVRGLLVSMLEAAGFETLQASDGREALNHFEGTTSSIAYVVVDLDMPVVNGLQCIQEIRARGFQVPALLVSGAGGELANLPPGVDRLQKPFRMDELTQRVHDALLSGA